MKRFGLLLMLMLVILSGCGGASGGNFASAPAAPQAMPGDMAAEAPAIESGGAPGRGTAEMTNQALDQATQADIERLIIKNASLSIEVQSVRDAEAAIRDRVAQLGGYVVTVETSGTDTFQRTSVTFRVPANQFDAALEGVQGLATRVLGRSISGQDVTEEFVDLQSRLRNLEATRDRLLDLLEQANRVEDALNVNNALTDVQGQIEQIKGRMQYLQQSAALSTINVYLQPIPTTPIVEEGLWRPLEVARGALRGLLEFAQELINLAIVLLIWIPVWGPIILFLRWIWRRLTGGGKRTAASAAPTAPAATSAEQPQQSAPDHEQK
ncbi:MAG TPA: DUF4349 domain-containing protein [Roseiflexaceae bacterium]|nr:DUF4349 domain-containing protein [Roseiflexaceae bacterium]HMP42135.1 DUF4349 domain-containing protein [Roseiflexaceae bacterium]